MATIFDFLIPIAVGAVAAVLMLGLRAMSKPGNSAASQKLMRWRVILQAFAVVVIMVAVYLRQTGS